MAAALALIHCRFTDFMESTPLLHVPQAISTTQYGKRTIIIMTPSVYQLSCAQLLLCLDNHRYLVIPVDSVVGGSTVMEDRTW